nr:MAG TPA: hypothetical protein [Caudoviricetes sp.]
MFSDIIKRNSTSQRRDRVGFAPTSLLSLKSAYRGLYLFYNFIIWL